MKRIALIPGDGIGVDVTRQAASLLGALADAGRVDVALDTWDLGAERTLRTGITITDEEMASLRTDYDAIFLGAVGDPRIPDNRHARDILLGLRFKLDLYINLRPVRLYAPELSPLKDIGVADLDMVIFRENTEGPYVGMGGTLKEGTPEEVATEVDINTRAGVERIIRAAFEYARLRGRRRVTLTDKANAMPHVGGLWRRTFADVRAEYAGIESDAVYADALAFDLVRRPARYDVIVAPNLFGDLLSDLAAGLAGGLGLAASANLHPGRPGLFEPVHGSAPDIAGTGQANPLAALLTTALMLEQLGWVEEAARVEAAVREVLAAGHTTPDLGGTLTTDEVGDAVITAALAT
ncbi:MAG: isocitrate/isopropylmalate dehydrogenase family protein [Gemmatimonadota bacterium]